MNENLRTGKSGQPDVQEYFSGLTKGDRRYLSMSITLIESTRPLHRKPAFDLVEKCLPLSGNSLRIGITGVPGAGKSTFINVFGTFLTALGKKVAVLAVDPSSQKSRGSILGDKTRMNELSTDPNAFIRPSPSSGSLGGVARATRESIILCEAAGYDIIIVETVGVGQSETAVHSMVDFFLLLMITGAGDELQGIKRGIMEMADALVINKAEGDNLEKAKAAKAELAHALHLFPSPESGWVPRVETCSSIENTGIEKIWDIILEHQNAASIKGYFHKNRQLQAEYWMMEGIIEGLRSAFFHQERIKKLLPEYKEKVRNGALSPYLAASELLEIFKTGKP